MARINFNPSDVTRQINKFINSVTPITPVNQGGAARAMVDATVVAMTDGFDKVDQQMSEITPMSAIGNGIDNWAKLVGLNRRPPKYGEVTQADRTFRFYVNRGTFGDINNGSPISIPSGTLLYSNSPTRQAGNVIFQTTSLTVLPSSESEYFVSAISLEPSVRYNVPAGYIRLHNFQNYADNLSGSLRISNENPVTSASSKETDTDFKRRMLNSFRGETNSVPDIINMIRSISGVSDVIYLPNIDGLGTITIIVQGTTALTSTGLLSSIEQAVVNKFITEGLVIYVRSPNYVGISVDIPVVHLPNISESDKILTELSLRQNLTTLLANSRIGAGVTLQEIRQAISTYTSSFKNIGTTRDLFDAVYVYKDAFGIRAPQKTIGDVVIGKGDKITPEFSIANPINIIRLG